MPHPPRVDVRLVQHARVDTRHHLQQPLQGSHLLDLLDRGQEVRQIELSLPRQHLLLQALGLAEVDRLLRALHQADDVPHLEDPAGHALRVEDREVLGPLARPDESDRHAEHAVDRERRAPAGVAVHLREDDPRKPHRAVESLGDPHRLLPGHPVRYEQDLMGLHGRLHAAQFVQQFLIRLQPAGHVEEQVRDPAPPRLVQRAAGEFRHVLAARPRQKRDADPRRQHLQLLGRRRAVGIARDEPRPPPLLGQASPQLRRRRRLPRPLQADEHDHRGRDRRLRFLGRRLPQQGDEFVVDDLHDLIARPNRLHHILAERALLHLREEAAHDPEVDVRLEQGAPHFAQPFVQHLFRDDAALAQLFQRTVEPVTETFEHPPFQASFQASKKRDWKVSIRVSRRRRTARTRSVLSRQV